MLFRKDNGRAVSDVVYRQREADRANLTGPVRANLTRITNGAVRLVKRSPEWCPRSWELNAAAAVPCILCRVFCIPAPALAPLLLQLHDDHRWNIDSQGELEHHGNDHAAEARAVGCEEGWGWSIPCRLLLLRSGQSVVGSFTNQLFFPASGGTRRYPIMQCQEVVQFTGLLATHSGLLLRSRHELPMEAISGYWLASRQRFESWSRTLRQYSRQLCMTATQDIPLVWQSLSPTLEEVLSTEILTRVMGAMGAVYYAWTGDVGPATLTRNVWLHHLDVRRRTLNLLLFGHGFDLRDWVTLNQQRRRHEAWTDRLLSCLPAERCVQEFTFCRHRANRKSSWQPVEPHQQLTRTLILSGLRMAYRQQVDERTPHPELNRQIVTAVLNAFGPDLFDSAGVLKPSDWTRYPFTLDETMPAPHTFHLPSSRPFRPDSHGL